ncbi:MAG: hypothetical protein LAT54_05010, partial [Cryomorphaceae bacterium]|nr:hypothetical protein [Cryomorphaceae bacterium]
LTRANVLFGLFLALLSISTELRAQIEHRYITTIYTDEGMLPQNNVRSVAKDQYGFLWVCTENGLTRFDGELFTTINAEELGLSSNRFRYFARSGEILYASNASGEFLEIKDLNVRLIDNLPLSIEKNWQDLTYRNKLFYQDTKFPDEGENWRLVSEEDSWEAGVGFVKQVRNNDTVNYITQAEMPLLTVILRGALYVFYKNEYLVIKDKHMQKFPLNFKINFDKVFWNRAEEQLFFIQHKHVYLMKTNSENQLQAIEVGHEIEESSFAINSMLYDEDVACLYQATNSFGLIRQQKSHFDFVHNDIGLRNVFYGLGMDSKGFIHTSTGMRIDVTGKADTSNYKMWFNALEASPDGRFFRVHDHTLLSMDENNRYDTAHVFPGRLLSLNIDTLRNILWVGTDSLGDDPYKLYAYDLNNNEVVKSYVINSTVRSMHFTANSMVYIGTYNGIIRWNVDTEVFEKIGGKALGEVRYIHRLDDEILLINTYGRGVYFLKNDQLIPLSMDVGEFLRFSHYVIEDENNMIWIPTNRGLFQFQKSDLVTYAQTPQDHLPYHQYFDRTSGLVTNEFNGGCNLCAVRAPNGYWYLPTMNGLVVFKPELIPLRAMDPHIFITKAISDEGKFSHKATLSPNTSLVEFTVAAPHLGFSFGHNIKARLSSQNQWLDVDKNKVIRFIGLPPGEYSLQLQRPISFNGEVSTVTFLFTIKPPFWKTTPFFMLLLVSLLGVVFMVIKIRTRFLQVKSETLEKMVDDQTIHLRGLVKDLKSLIKQEKALSKERERVVSILAHDVRSPLRFLTFMFSALKTGNTDRLKEDIDIAHDTCANLHKYVEDILSSGKHPDEEHIELQQQVNVYQLVMQKVNLFRGLALQKSIEIKVQMPKKVSVFTNRNILSIVVHNLIDNAIKFTPDGGKIDIKWEPLLHQLEVSNTGKSFNKKETEDINRVLSGDLASFSALNIGGGMRMISELSQIAEIKVYVKENVRKGVVFVVEVL